jgi:predicted acetyltransferase
MFAKGGSHIGYGIRPTERRKGYNKINLYLGLLQEQRLGEKRVLLECLADNIGSNKTITALGGILEKSEIDDWDNELTNYYWIDVDKSIDKYKPNYIQFLSKRGKKI